MEQESSPVCAMTDMLHMNNKTNRTVRFINIYFGRTAGF